eukprot:TRINITY_DN549_c1_g1_i1.p1 TRINITY_DN549_c1_g1~~TRINITY_DN549_c1_g1_i1.p1  ORF type:complete len:438 (+),score=143.33 TRINITY_DN549_c1_g1_i1:54-1367(+)
MATEEAYPEIVYGAAVPERITSDKMEKKMKKIIKEGGKRGVEIEGAADMGGLQFFCTTMDEPNGDADLLYESMKAMNAKSDPTEEERKGGSGRIGKMLVSKDQEDSKLALVTYCPPAKHGELKADQWMKDILEKLGGGEVLFGDAYTAKAELKNDSEKGLFVLKLKDSAISESINYLKSKGLFPDKTDDSDDEFVFGDDDFPQGGEDAAEEEQAENETCPAEEANTVPAPTDAETEECAEPYPEIVYGAAVPERITSDKMEKKMKKIIKEGGKRGVEIEGAADMGGLQFFCTTMDEPNGDADLLYESMKAMNAKSDPTEEERKGGSGRIGKMLVSKNQEDSKLALVAYCPPAKHGELKADQWMKDILEKLGGGEVLFGDAYTAKAELKNDSEKGLFVLKLKDSAISESINYLKSKGLFPDKTDDSDDEMVFGDDDFP